MGSYVTDFYCPKLKLDIEIDGYSHIENFRYDKKRESYFLKLGIKIIRYHNQQIKNDLENVWEDLTEQIKQRKRELGQISQLD